MRKTIVLITIILLILSLHIHAKTHALIIGVGDYENEAIEDLPNAISDANQFAKALEQTGLVANGSLRIVEDPSYADLLDEIEKWIEKGEQKDRMIFYYAGHSEIAENASGEKDTYLCPVNVKKRLLTRTSYNFRKEWETSLSEKLKAKETLMIFDTCYAGGIVQQRPLLKPEIRSKEFEGHVLAFDQDDLKRIMDAYIHYYHCLRPHGSPGYSTPYAFRRQFFENRCDSMQIEVYV